VAPQFIGLPGGDQRDWSDFGYSNGSEVSLTNKASPQYRL